MSTRRSVLWLGASAALVSACGKPTRQPDPAVPGELLRVATTGGLAVLDTRAGRQVVAAAEAVATPDGRYVISAATAGSSTRLTVHDATTGAVVSAASLRGHLGPRAVSPDGQSVALVEGGGTDPHRPIGRSGTTVVVAGPTGERHRLTLPGCVEPEAFSSADGQLFVLDYLPPTQPDRYRVRVLDLAAGGMNPLNLPNVPVKTIIPPGAEEEMRGQGRQAVYHRPTERLFTLYTHQPEHEHVRDKLNAGARPGQPEVHAFVHTLSVREGWAYCVDLPAPFGDGPAEGHAIAATRSGSDLYVFDAGSGAVARIDPFELVITNVARFSPTNPPVAESSAAAVSVDTRRLFLAGGEAVMVFDTKGLGVVDTWTLPAAARGVAASPTTLYVGQPGRVLVLDPGTGAPRRAFPAPDLVKLAALVG